jgi:hypothetical protein
LKASIHAGLQIYERTAPSDKAELRRNTDANFAALVRGMVRTGARTNYSGEMTMPRWTAEARAKQAALITAWQPWCASTGPRTADGKAKVARNADKGGDAGRAARLQCAQDELAQALAKVELMSKRQRLRQRGITASHF